MTRGEIIAGAFSAAAIAAGMALLLSTKPTWPWVAGTAAASVLGFVLGFQFVARRR